MILIAFLYKFVNMIQRILQPSIEKRMLKGKVIIISGPRQCGKTTLVKHIVETKQKSCLWLNADEPDVVEILTRRTSTYLKSIIGKNKILVIDEAQRITDIGITLKLIHDQIKGVQVIATGSSSLDLLSAINEPLTGRKYEYTLLPFSFEEMKDHTSLLEEKRVFEQRLVYGYYPDVVLNPADEKIHLKLLTDSYLYKDLLMYQNMKKPTAISNLLKALALQLGSEVSYNELAQIIGIDRGTIEKYIDLLEKTFIIFKLPSLRRNHRNEIKLGKKIYFFDNGVRNALLNDFNSINLRSDKGALFENFMIAERYKYTLFNQIHCNRYFWRTHLQQEIDYIEEKGGMLNAFEFKWSDRKKPKMNLSFSKAYPKHSFQFIHAKNFEELIG